jgi:short-subunit dehydrogenase
MGEPIRGHSDKRENAMDLGLHNKHAIVARNQADLEATRRELAAETNRRMVPLTADVASKEQMERMVAEAATQLAVSRARRSGKAVVAIR